MDFWFSEPQSQYSAHHVLVFTSLSISCYLNLSLILNFSLSNTANIGSFNLGIASFRAVVFIFALGMCVSISICFVLVLIVIASTRVVVLILLFVLMSVSVGVSVNVNSNVIVSVNISLNIGQESDDGSVGGPDENHPASALARHCEGQNGEDDGDPLLTVHGSLSGVAQRERAGAYGLEMGPGGQKARRGRVDCAAKGRRGHGDPGGAHHNDQGAAGGGEVSCNQAIERAVSGPHAHHAAGNRAENIGLSHGMERIQEAHTVSHVGDSRSLPSSGKDPTEPLGPEAGCLGQISGLRLGNRGNLCYSNATMRSLLHLAA